MPDGYLKGSIMIFRPMCLGYSLGICLDRYTEEGQRRISAFACPALMCRDHIPFLEHEQLWDRIHIDELDTIIESVQGSFQSYSERMGELKQFAFSNLEYMYRWPSMNALLDVVQAHYLDRTCLLPEFALTEESIRKNINVTMPYEESHLRWVLTLASEWKSADYQDLREARVRDWLSHNKISPTMFNLSADC